MKNNRNNQHSVEWSLSKELAKSNRKLRIIVVILITLWLVTVAGLIITLKSKCADISSNSVSEQISYTESDGITIHETEVS